MRFDEQVSTYFWSRSVSVSVCSKIHPPRTSINIKEYTVLRQSQASFGKCVDVVPTIKIWAYPNQKLRMNGDIGKQTNIFNLSLSHAASRTPPSFQCPRKTR
jgi:hypothetical protein